jgi:hypothetical protein
MRASFCPLVIVEGHFAGLLAQIGQAETAADLRDLSELADDTRDSATGDWALVWLPGLPGEFGPNSNAPRSPFHSDSGSLLRHCPPQRWSPAEQTVRFRASEITMMVEVGKFRVIAQEHLTEFAYGSDKGRMRPLSKISSGKAWSR